MNLKSLLIVFACIFGFVGLFVVLLIVGVFDYFLPSNNPSRPYSVAPIKIDTPEPQRKKNVPEAGASEDLVNKLNSQLEEAIKTDQDLLAEFPSAKRSDKNKIVLFTFETTLSKNIAELIYSPDGSKLLCIDYDENAQLWDVRKKSLVCALQKDSKGRPRRPVFSADGSKLAAYSFGKGNRILIWNADTGKEIQRFSLSGGFPVQSLAFSADSKLILASGYKYPQSQVRFWNVESGKEYKPLPLPYHPRSLAVCPDGKQLATAGKSQIDFWEYPSCRLINTIPCTDLPTIEFSRNGRWLASLEDHQVQIIDLKTNVTTLVQERKGFFRGPAFLGDGQRLALNCSSTNQTFRIYEVPSLRKITGCSLGGFTQACSPGGHLVATAKLKTVTIKDVSVLVAKADYYEAAALTFKSISWKGFWITNEGKYLQVRVTAPTKFSTDNTGESDLMKAATLPRITKLHLIGRFSDEGLMSLPKFQQLEKLKLENIENLTGVGFSHLKSLKHLNELELLRLPQMATVDSAALPKLPQLSVLKLVTLTKVTDSWLENLKHTPNLEHLTLSDLKQLGTKDNLAVPKLEHLRNLELESMPQLTDSWFKNLNRVHNLERLLLKYLPNITDSGLVHLKSLKKLKQLDIIFPTQSPGKLTGDCLVHLQDLPNLKKLVLWEVPLTNTQLDYLRNMKHLESLTLYGSTLSEKRINSLRKSLPNTRINGTR